MTQTLWLSLVTQEYFGGVGVVGQLKEAKCMLSRRVLGTVTLVGQQTLPRASAAHSLLEVMPGNAERPEG